MVRKKKRAIVHVTETRAKPPTYCLGWKVFSTIASYDRRLHADNLAERLDAELVDAVMK